MRFRKRLAALSLAVAIASPAHAEKGGALDAFLARPADRALALDPSADGVHVAHTEPRLGLPTFVWTDAARFAGTAGTPEAAARSHLRRLAALYRLQPGDVENLALHRVHDTGEGAIVASFGQRVNGIDVFRNEIDLVLDRSLALVAASGYVAPGELAAKARFASFTLGAEDAVTRAFRELTGVELGAGLLLPAESEGAYRAFDLPAGVDALLGWQFVVPARVKQVFFTLPDELVPGWYVELNVGGAQGGQAPYVSFVVDARDGGLLFRNDLTVHAQSTYRAFALPYDRMPDDGPQGTSATPHPTGNPDGYRPPLAPANDVEISNYPFSQADAWLAANATETRGNNVDAYADLASPDGFQPGLDLRGQATAPGQFLHAYDHARGPQQDDEQITASVTNLFYVTNFLHDWFYDAGFDERAGNAQTLNFGRGGLGNDALRAEAQDYGGRNNANMATPADGAAPRMQTYLFDGAPEVSVTAPAALAGLVASEDGIGALQFDVAATLQIPDPSATTLGCSPFPANFFAGRIALLDRGTCTFASKALNAQAAGAIAVLIANNAAGPAQALGGDDPRLTIPTVPVSQATGAAWKAYAAGHPGTSIELRLRGGPNLARDSALDNTIVAHEWGHMLSNRLIADANGLTNPAGRAMGEGWGDFVALLVVVRAEDINVPSNADWRGSYALAGYAEGGGAKDASYFGIRRVPYSTSRDKNDLALRHVQEGVPLPTTQPLSGAATGIGNSEVHNAGEVWATMLWESYATLLRAHPFQEAQDRMKRYLVASLAATPAAPTFLEARDALLAVAYASDPADYSRFAQAFAARGAGFGAEVADRNSADFVGVRESSSTGAWIATKVWLDDTAFPCDRDGVLDVGEVGYVTVEITNTGRTQLAQQSIVWTDRAGTARFPYGDTAFVPPLAPGATTRVRVPVELATPLAERNVRLRVTFGEPSLPAPVRTLDFSAPVHYDPQLGNAATDEMDGPPSAWSSEDGGWSWRREGDRTFAHRDDAAFSADSVLESPWIHVGATGNFVVRLVHRYSFEKDSAWYYDGGLIEATTDGVNWLDVYEDLGIDPGYVAYLETGGDNPLEDRAAFAGMSPGFPNWQSRVINFRTLFAGMDVKFRFRQGSDVYVGAYGWDIDSFGVTNATNLPFGAATVETSDGSTCNLRPVADAGASQRVWEGGLDAGGNFVRSLVTLDGSASFDPDGAPLSYAWRQVSGTPVSLDAPTAPICTFTPDVAWDERLTFELQVSDGVDTSLPATVDVVVQNVNRWPVAVAAAPPVVPERSVSSVILDGEASFDEDGEALTYRWTQVSGPEVALADASSARTSFALPEVAADTTFGFELVVSDGVDVSEPALVELTVQNVDRAPTVSAGDDLVAASRASVTLQAVAADPDGDEVVLGWQQISGPAVVLGDATFVAPSVPVDTVLAFEVTATAGGVSVRDTVDVTVLAEPVPFVDAGDDFAVDGRTTVLLRGQGTVPGGAVTYAWTQVSGAPVVLGGASSATASFVSPDVKSPSTLVFQLAVSANGMTATDTVSVTVAADRSPVVSAGDDASVASRAQVTLRATASDPEGDALAWSWVQLSGEPVELSGATTPYPSFVAPSVLVDSTLVFEVSVVANGLEARDTVAVSVAAEGVPVVSAGPDLAVAGRVPVKLVGTASGAGSVEWTQLSGPAVTIEDASSVVASFVSPDVKAETELVFALTARSWGQEASDTVRVVVAADRAPVAVVGADADVAARSTVVLRGAASDADGDAVTVAWTQVSGPDVVLSDASALEPTFVAPDWREDAPAELVFSLVASANGLESAPALVTVRVHEENRRPVAVGPNEIAEDERTPVTLVADGIDADGDELLFTWVQTGGPTVELTGADSASVSFVTPEVAADTRLSFKLTVRDSDRVDSEPVTVSVLVRNVNRAPVATARVVNGSVVVLDGSGSSDPDGGTLAFAWTQVEGAPVQLAGVDAAVATFAPVLRAQAQTLVFELTVRDADGLSAATRVSVELAPAAPKPAEKAEDGGCSTAGGSSGAGLLVVAALFAARRRRLA